MMRQEESEGRLELCDGEAEEEVDQADPADDRGAKDIEPTREVGLGALGAALGLTQPSPLRRT
jgi:hypothetical protein